MTLLMLFLIGCAISLIFFYLSKIRKVKKLKNKVDEKIKKQLTLNEVNIIIDDLKKIKKDKLIIQPYENDPFRLLKGFNPGIPNYVKTRLGPTKELLPFPTKFKLTNSISELKKDENYNEELVIFYKTLFLKLFTIHNASVEFRHPRRFGIFRDIKGRNFCLNFVLENSDIFNISISEDDLKLYKDSKNYINDLKDYGVESTEIFQYIRHKFTSEEIKKIKEIDDNIKFIYNIIEPFFLLIEAIDKFILDFYPSYSTSNYIIKCSKILFYDYYLDISKQKIYDTIQLVKNDKDFLDSERLDSDFYNFYGSINSENSQGINSINKWSVYWYNIQLLKHFFISVSKIIGHNPDPWPIIINILQALNRIKIDYLIKQYTFPTSMCPKPVEDLSYIEKQKLITKYEKFDAKYKRELEKFSLFNDHYYKNRTEEKLTEMIKFNQIENEKRLENEKAIAQKMQIQREKDYKIAKEIQQKKNEEHKTREKELKMERHFISEGHYKNGLGVDYMSIWTYKRKNGIINGDNYKEALKIICEDKFYGKFNYSDKFDSGWMYNTKFLNEFYKNQKD